MSTTILTLLIIISAAIHMRAEYLGPDLHIYIFKPLTTTMILALAALGQAKGATSYKRAILLGLIFSLIGDVLLMLPQDLFVPGLVIFLIAHVVYISAFRRGRPFRAWAWVQVPIALFGLGVYAFLSADLGDLRIPVAVYILVILTMIWQAWDQWDETRNRWATFALIGAVFFVASDTVLAVNKFSYPFTAARGLSLSTYYTAQWLIAYSVRRYDD